jgi:PKD repeat protein
LYNNGNEVVNLQNFYFSKGIEYTFPAMTLNPQSYMVVSKSPAFITSYFNVPSLQWNAGSALSNAGEPVVLKDLYGYVVDSVYFLPNLPWDTMANGRGPTLELCDPDADNSLAQNWRHAIVYKAKTPAGDSLWASPLDGCAYLPVAGFLASDSLITIGQSVTFTDASAGDIDSWSWEFERGIPETFSGQTPPPVTYNIMGAYDVTLTVRNIAGKSVKYKPAFIQIGPANVPQHSKENGFKVSPNPADNGRFTVIFPAKELREITLYSITGTKITTRESDEKEVGFDLSGMAGGLCFIQVRTLKNGKINTQKLIIQ